MKKDQNDHENDRPDDNKSAISTESTKSTPNEQVEAELVLNEQQQEDLKAKLSSDNLKKAFEKVVATLSKNVSNEVLYSNLALDEHKTIIFSDLAQLAKKIGLTAEMRRINVLDIKSGPAILMLKDGGSYVVIDKDEGYNPLTNIDETFDAAQLAPQYIGYTVFFYEDNLSVSSFVQKTGFLFNSVGKFRHVFIELVVISFFINLFAVVSPLYTMNVYDRVIPNYAIPTLFVLSFGMILVYLFDFAFKVIKSYLSDYISLSIGNEVDQVLLSRILLAKAPGINMSNGAKSALFKELSMVREFYFSRFIPALIDIPFLVLFFAVLMLISPWIALVPFVASIVVFVVNILLQVPLQNAHGKMMGEDQARTTVLIETLSGGESIKTFNATGKVLYKWRRALDKSYRHSYSYNLWVNIAANFSVFVMNIVIVMVVIVGVFEITGNVMTTGGLIATSTIAARIMTNVIGFSGMIVRYRSINTTLKHLEKVVLSPMEDDSASFGKKGPFKGNVKFNDVSFFYPGMKQPILSKCTFEIKPLDKVAIIGKTGAGKSTITRLLLGLDFNNTGTILLDNIDINNIHINEIRSSIGFMPQKSYFFHGTLRENILFSSNSATEEKYQRACELAGVSLVTATSARGDDMMIEEGGRNLSGGQQQIVALARAILNDPPIIIMDEPTNGMDTGLEATFMNNVKNYIKDKTFILITHKPSQLSLVERVILIDNSTVAIDDTKEKVIEILSKGKSKE